MGEVKIKICCLIPSLQPGGMERVMSELLNEFSLKNEVEIHLVLYGIKRDVFYSIPDSVKIHRPNFKFNNRLRPFFSLATLLYLRKKVNSIRPSSVLSFGEYWNSFVLLALLGSKLSIYVSDRCQPDKSLGRIHNFLRKWLYPSASGVIVQTEIAKVIFEQMFSHSNIQVIGNPIRTISMSTHVAREKVVLCVGRLIKSKNHDELIKLFARINHSGWKLVIIGDDALKQKNMARLQALIKSLGAEDVIELLGSRLDVEKFYLRSSIFVSTSSSEGFPNVIGEAQSAALPVIAFDCIAGPSDMIEDEINGFLVPLFDYVLFEQRLSQLMKDAELRLRLGTEAFKSIQAFNSTIICDKYFKMMLNRSN